MTQLLALLQAIEILCGCCFCYLCCREVTHALEFPLDRFLYNKGHNWGKFPVQISPSAKMGSEDPNPYGVNHEGTWPELLEGSFS